MESKKINQLATAVNPSTSDLAIIGDPVTGVSKKITWLQVSTLIGTAANLQQVTDNGATTTNPIAIGGLTITGLSTGVLKSDSGVISSVPFGAANGVATLAGDGKVPSNQLPSYVDDVVEVANYAALPVTGETGKIYITLDNNKVYRWGGSVYVEIAANNAIWGSITGTLANQTDLQNALNLKATDSLVVHLAGTETITGTKTFSNPSKNDGGILLQNGSSYSLSGYMNLGGMTDGLRFTSGGGISNYFALPSSVGYTYTFPAISGTIVAISGGNSTQYIDGTGALQTFPTLVSSDKLVKLVRNQSGATMTAGTIVYISGATGNKPLITKALATGDSTSAQTYGLVQANIANNADGYVVVIGNIGDLDTSALTEGQQLYLSGTTAGAYTTTKPYAPIHLVYVGIVLRSHPNQGIIGVKIQNGYEMDELHNVDAQSPSNNDILSYNTSTSLWEHKQIATTLGFTPISLASLSATSPLSYNNTTGAFSIQVATASQNGYLSSTDWSTFNNKQAALGGTGFVKISGSTISYDNSTYYLASNPSGFITLASLSAGAGISYSNITGVISSTITQYTDALARAAISSSATGLTYTSATGVFSLTAGYAIPTTAKQTEWDTAYTNRITSLTTTGTSGVATLVANTLNIPNYTTDLSGYVTLATSQTITGAKTFSETLNILKGTRTLSLGAVGYANHINIDSGVDFSFNYNNANTTGGIGFYAGTTTQKFYVNSLGEITTGSYKATAIADTYISSAATWNAKQAALNGTGFVKATGTTISYDNSTYLTTGSAASTYVPYTGATGNVNLGSNNLLLGSGNAGGHIDLVGTTDTAYINIESAGCQVNYNSSRITTTDKQFGGTFTLDLRPSLVTGNAFIQYFQPVTGTIALTSQIPSLAGYVPYTGATANVNLGAYALQAGGVITTGRTTSDIGGSFVMKIGNGSNNVGDASSVTMYAPTASQLMFVYKDAASIIKLVSLSPNQPDSTQRYFSWPSSDGQLALVSQLPSLSGYVTGSGSTNYIPKWSSGSAVGNSAMYDSSGNIGFNTTFNMTSYQTTGLKSIQVNSTILKGATASTENHIAFFTSADSTNPLGLMIGHSTGATTATKFTYIESSEIGLSPNTLRLNQSGGRVLVGNVDDGSTKFQVNGNIRGLSSIKIANSGAEEAILQVTMSYADGYRAVVRLTNSHTGGRDYGILSTNTSDGVFGAGKFAFYDYTSNSVLGYFDASHNLSISNDFTTGGKILISDGGNTTIPCLKIGSATTGISQAVSEQMNFITSSSTRLTISSTGVITATTGAYDFPFKVVGQNTGYGASILCDATNGAGGNKHVFMSSGSTNGAIGGGHCALYDATNDRYNIVITNTGKIHIGGYFPTYTDPKCQIRTGASYTNTAANQILFIGSSDSTGPLGIVFQHSNVGGRYTTGLVGTRYGVSGNDIEINTEFSGTGGMIVRYQGNVLVGHASENNFGTARSIQINGAGGSLVETRYNGTSGVRFGSGSDHAYMHDPRNAEMRFATSDSTRFYIYGNGNYSFTGSNVSDRRAKDNISLLDITATDKIMSLEAKSYNMKNNPSQKRYGFIAQEVKQIVSDLVSGNENDGYLGLDYDGLLTLTIKALQEQQKEIQKLKEK